MSQVIYDGTFAGAATSGGTINDTCSVGTASAWIDANASWHMDGSAHLLPNTGLSYSSTPLKRPAGESYRDVNVSAIISTTAGTAPRGILLFARINGLARVGAHMVPGAQSAFYYWDSAGAFSAVNFANGPTLTAGHRYKYEFVASGASPATFTMNWYDLDGGSPGTVVQTYSTTSSLAGIQVAGVMGLGNWNAQNGIAAINEVILTNLVTAITLSPSSGYTSQAVSCTATMAAVSWTAGTTMSISGANPGGASITGYSFNAGTQIATFTLNTGTSATTLTIANSFDANVATFTVSVASALTSGGVAFVSSSPTAIVLSGNTPSGGVGPYTYQWYYSSASGFIPPGAGSVLTGQTTLSATDSSPPSSGYRHYKMVTTDSLSTQAVSSQVTSTKWATALKIGAIGDSITGGTGSTVIATTWLANDLATLSYLRGVTITNRGASGTTSTDWLPAGSNLPAARTAILAAGCTHVSLMLGTNDSKVAVATSAATYGSNLSAIANYLVAGGLIVVIHYPIYVVPGVYSNTWLESSLVLLEAYQTQIDALANGTTILVGDKLGYAAFAANPSWFADGVHPADSGTPYLGEMWARAFDKVLNPVAASGGLIRVNLNGGF